MKKKAYIVILIFSIVGLWEGIGDLIEGIGMRGIDGVNYGRVGFPLLVGVIAVKGILKQGDR